MLTMQLLISHACYPATSELGVGNSFWVSATESSKFPHYVSFTKETVKRYHGLTDKEVRLKYKKILLLFVFIQSSRSRYPAHPTQLNSTQLGFHRSKIHQKSQPVRQNDYRYHRKHVWFHCRWRWNRRKCRCWPCSRESECLTQSLLLKLDQGMSLTISQLTLLLCS